VKIVKATKHVIAVAGPDHKQCQPLFSNFFKATGWLELCYGMNSP